ncbi:MAG: nucleoside hydrolase [Acidobacteriota bacterium]|nr:nucleoside hydrolase [Acidobacteriota bacterium]
MIRASLWALLGGVAMVARAQVPVWIDTDPSVARGGHEIDDGFALIQAFHSKEIAIRGVSVVFGNAPLQTALPIAQELLRLINPSGPKPYAGAASALQLGEPTAASRALIAALRKEKLTILAIGPVTNIATVLKTHPELSRRIERIVAVAGRRPDQQFLVGTKNPSRPLRDFNFEMDPAAMQIILDSKVSLVLAPFEISSRVWITAADVEALKGRSPLLDWLYGPAVDWLGLWKRSFGVDGFNPFDTLAVAVVTSPQLVSCETLPVHIEELPDDTGVTGNQNAKAYLLLSSKIQSMHSVSYCYEAKPEFKTDLMRRLLNAP